MQVTGNNKINRIFVQLGLSGYSFKTYTSTLVYSSEWMSADRIFTTPELQKTYDEVAISIFSPKFTLVPISFFSKESLKETLSSLVNLNDADPVNYTEIVSLGSVLIYSTEIGESLSKVISHTLVSPTTNKVEIYPEIYWMLESLSNIADYNKIIVSYLDGFVYIVIAQGKTLLLCTSFEAQDFTTAQYFIFRALKRLQLNPEISTIYFRTPLDESELMSLYRYFKAVEQL